MKRKGNIIVKSVVFAESVELRLTLIAINVEFV